MKSSSSKEDASAAGGQPGKPPHWRRRDPAPTAVYVVHPTQFRTVVQQLTGAASSPLPVSTVHGRCQGEDDGGAGTDGGGTNAAARHQQLHGRSEDRSSGRTLGQIHQEFMAWADAADC